ncbi:hypothetical protein [Methylobacillus sp.]|uniref:hypothetical protein n=1 Tax=Methylobacillus sp. TaxID=56818 RepID=UPI0012BFB517|nr:hypothetical protein [Methylobacillus sp.]MPS48560.1 hypothetical protein [Methylobacillus sp.]
MLNFLKTWQTTLWAAAIAAGLGMGAGWYVANKFQKAEKVDQVEQAQKDSQESLRFSNEIAAQLFERKEEVYDHYAQATKRVVEYVPKTVYKECRTQDGGVVPTTLSVSAVRVLNSTVLDPYVQPATVVYEESQTATEVGLRELSDYIIVIKKQYEDLAIDHDALVDYANEYKRLINQ